MIRRLSVIAVLCALCLGFGSMLAQAQLQVRSQTFFFNGTCTGTDQVFSRTFSPTITATSLAVIFRYFKIPQVASITHLPAFLARPIELARPRASRTIAGYGAAGS